MYSGDNLLLPVIDASPRVAVGVLFNQRQDAQRGCAQTPPSPSLIAIDPCVEALEQNYKTLKSGSTLPHPRFPYF